MIEAMDHKKLAAPIFCPIHIWNTKVILFLYVKNNDAFPAVKHCVLIFFSVLIKVYVKLKFVQFSLLNIPLKVWCYICFYKCKKIPVDFARNFVSW